MARLLHLPPGAFRPVSARRVAGSKNIEEVEMIHRSGLLASSIVLALFGSGVAACGGADVPAEEPISEQAGSVDQELLGPGWLCGGPRARECAADRFCASLPGRCPDARHFG